MDEQGLVLYGLGGIRLTLARILRAKVFMGFQVFSIALFGLILAAEFICYDIWFDDRAQFYVADESEKGKEWHDMQSALFMIEIILLCLFTIEILLHIIAYGMLYVRTFDTWLGFALTLTNLVLIFLLYMESLKDQSLFGVKMLVSVTLLYMRLVTL